MSKKSGRPVVVAVAGSRNGRAAIRLAADEAAYRQAPLIAVTAYQEANPFAAPTTRPVATLRAPADAHALAESRLGDELAEVLGDREAQAELRAVPGLAGRRLVETARAVDAQLLVLGAARTTSILSGLVTQYVLRNAPCPVLVVPDSTRADGDYGA